LSARSVHRGVFSVSSHGSVYMCMVTPINIVVLHLHPLQITVAFSIIQHSPENCLLNQKPFLEGPPLYYASLALIFKTFGGSDKVARIPSAFFAFAAVLVVFFMANLLFGPIETEELASVIKILQEENPFYIVMRDKREEAEKELLNSGNLSVLVKQMVGADSALLLLSNRPANGTLTIGDTFKNNEVLFFVHSMLTNKFNHTGKD
jgi:hypothetical protein